MGNLRSRILTGKIEWRDALDKEAALAAVGATGPDAVDYCCHAATPLDFIEKIAGTKRRLFGF